MTAKDPSDARLYYPATQRNKDAILDVLRETLPTQGNVLEIASGSGEHALHFAQALRSLAWQPSDPDPRCLASIMAWRTHMALDNLLAPLSLDSAQTSWPLDHADAVFNANMIHIAPWAACQGLMAGCGRLLDPGAPLVLYGPFKRHGAHTSSSNETFDASLQARDPRWGVRDLGRVVNEAKRHGLQRLKTVPMPANNLTVIFEKLPK